MTSTASAGARRRDQGDPEHTRAFFRRSLEAWRKLDHGPGFAAALATVGLAEWAAGQPSKRERCWGKRRLAIAGGTMEHALNGIPDGDGSPRPHAAQRIVYIAFKKR